MTLPVWQIAGGPANRSYADKFASDHKVDFPFVVDPQGKFAAEVNADRDIGKAIKLDHTPTAYVVSIRHPERPFVMVVQQSQFDRTLLAIEGRLQSAEPRKPEVESY